MSSLSLFFNLVHHIIQTRILACLIDRCLHGLCVRSCVCVDADGWEPPLPTGRTRITQYPSDVHRPQLSSGFPLTVKDLLLSGTSEPVSLPWSRWEFDRVGGDGVCGGSDRVFCVFVHFSLAA